MVTTLAVIGACAVVYFVVKLLSLLLGFLEDRKAPPFLSKTLKAFLVLLCFLCLPVFGIFAAIDHFETIRRDASHKEELQAQYIKGLDDACSGNFPYWYERRF